MWRSFQSSAGAVFLGTQSARHQAFKLHRGGFEARRIGIAILLDITSFRSQDALTPFPAGLPKKTGRLHMEILLFIT
jgi:hypothetical protein